MSDEAITDHTYRRALAEIDRMQAETRKFAAEQNKLAAEQNKLAAEASKLAAEQSKLFAEADKFKRERFLAPIVAASALGGALAAIVALLLRGVVVR